MHLPPDSIHRQDIFVKTPAAVSLWALAGCSGAAFDSSSLTIADRDFIPDSIAHLRSFLGRGGDNALMQVAADVVDERVRLGPAPSASAGANR